jgi:hypothetical protein
MFHALDKLYKNYLKMKFLNQLMNIIQNTAALLKDLNTLKNPNKRKKKKEEPKKERKVKKEKERKKNNQKNK